MTPELPAKLTRLFEFANKLKLKVEAAPDARGLSDIHAWTIRHPDQDHRSRIFVYWTPGPRGGRLAYYAYSPIDHKSRKCTRSVANSWLHTIAD